ncbi:peptide MFS transporter [Vitiosangium sp. GDMCC 1.1324]|uniref:peptide MFS transporter n=1 Tax=Vitiosangium sp. (strain GDMCC 1.1324) TaxID=2138576 RepID=UPI000D3D711D|nr:peptide MFS transporter [Vitiosangium sp. GDMCC 1.1324]PTL81721.1 MFS transporter [Vitiosangium sp. GDMCC 1.1324]
MTKTPAAEFASDSPAPVPPTGGPSSPAPEQKGFFGHPRGLATLFFTEMWERFSFYGMRALLILFMTATAEKGGLGFSGEKAGAIYGLYGAGVYLTAMPGGWLADRILGQRRAVLFGGCIIALGHFSMALPGTFFFFLGLLLIVLGTGLLKPNISAMVGGLYPEGGARRDAGFSIFYMGINIGAFTAPIVVGLLGERVNWHVGFGAAGVGMVFGVIQYLLGGKHLGEVGKKARSADLRPEAPGQLEKSGGSRMAGFTVVGVLVGLLVVLQLLGVVDLTSAVGLARAGGFIIVTLALAFFAYQFTAGGLDATEKRRLAVIGVFFIASTLFWAGFEQAGSSLNLFARDATDRVVFGWEVPASTLQAVNALFIIALAPVFAWMWVRLNKQGREPSSPAKFSLGLVLMGAGFAVMVVASLAAAGGHKVSPAWLVLTYLLHTLGELSLSPVGLSTVTKLAPQRVVGQMMGVWFMSMSLGNLIAGQLAGLLGTNPTPIFGAVAAVAIGAGLLLAIAVRPLRRMMGGVH